MGIDFNKPTVTDNYASAFVSNIIANQIALAQWLDSVQTSVANGPVYGKRYNRTSGNFEEWNGGAWVQLKFQGIQTDTTGNNVGIGGAASATNRLTVQSAAGASAYPQADLHNGTSHLSLFAAAATGSFNGLVQSGDQVILFHGGASNNAASNLVIGPWHSATAGVGMRIAADGGVNLLAAGAYPLTIGNGSVTGAQHLRMQTSASDLNMGQSAGTIFGVAAGGIGFLVQSGTSPFGLGTFSAQDLLLGTSNTERLRIAAGGNIGIGGAASSPLHVWSAGTSNVFQVYSTSAGSGQVMVGNFSNASDADFNIFISQAGAASKFATIGPSVAVPLNFQVGGANRMVLTTTGLALNVPLQGKAAASTVGATQDWSVLVQNNGGTGDSNVAALGFLCSGQYGVKLHLRHDGLFGLGGWSSASWRWYSDASGNMTATGNVAAYSDERRKRDWADLPEDFIARLAGVRMGTYSRTDSGERQVGVGAQSIRGLLPEAVAVGGDGDTLTLAYGNAALASAVALAREVVALRERVAELEAA